MKFARTPGSPLPLAARLHLGVTKQAVACAKWEEKVPVAPQKAQRTSPDAAATNKDDIVVTGRCAYDMFEHTAASQSPSPI